MALAWALRSPQPGAWRATQGMEGHSPISLVGEMSHGDFGMTWRLWAKFYTPFNTTPHLKLVNRVTLLKKRSWHCYVLGNTDSLLRHRRVSVMYIICGNCYLCVQS